MDLDFRKLNSTKLFDFSKEEENLITEAYLNIEDSIYNQFTSDSENPFSLFTPKCKNALLVANFLEKI